MATSAGSLPGDVCLAIPQMLEDLAGNAMNATKRTKIGFADALRSTFNNANTDDVMYDKGNGQINHVKVRYMPRFLPSQVSTSALTDCEGGNELGYEYEDVDVSLCVNFEMKVQEIYVKELCAGKSAYFRDMLLRTWDAMAVTLEDQLLTKASTLFGVNIDTGSALSKDIQLLDATNDKKILATGQVDFFLNDLEDANRFGGTPIIVGQGIIDQYRLLQGIACCNDLGFDLSQSLGAFAFFKSQRANAVLGANECIVMDPGAVKWIRYFKYRENVDPSLFTSTGAYGSFELADGTMKGMLVDPRTNLMYDVYIQPNHCNNEWYIRLELIHDLWVQPAGLDPADDLYGSNGLLSYRFTDS